MRGARLIDGETIRLGEGASVSPLAIELRDRAALIDATHDSIACGDG